MMPLPVAVPASVLGPRSLAVPARDCIHFMQHVVWLAIAREWRLKVCSTSRCSYMCHRNNGAYTDLPVPEETSYLCHSRETTPAQPHLRPAQCR